MFEMVKLLPKIDGIVYGIPRCGAIVAGMYATVNKLKMTYDINEATILVDDTVFNGKAYRKYNTENKYYLSLIWHTKSSKIPLSDKNFGVMIDPKDDYVFPMEYATRGNQAHVNSDDRVLVLEDLESKKNKFRKILPNCVIVNTADDCIEALKTLKFNCLFLDHDLENESVVPMNVNHKNTGSEVARFLCNNEQYKPRKIFIHSENNSGSKHIKNLLKTSEMVRSISLIRIGI